MSQQKWQKSARTPQEVLWHVSLYKVKASEEAGPAKPSWDQGSVPWRCNARATSHCLWGSIYAPSKSCVLSSICSRKTSHALSCVCFAKISFHKTPSGKTSDGTTEFPKKPDIFTLGLNFHLLWPLGFQGIFTGKCLWQDSLWLTKADTLDWPVAVRNSCKVQVSVPSSSNSFLLVGVVRQRQIWVGLGFLRLPACSTGRRQISVMIILLLGDFFSRFFSK